MLREKARMMTPKVTVKLKTTPMHLKRPTYTAPKAECRQSSVRRCVIWASIQLLFRVSFSERFSEKDFPQFPTWKDCQKV